MKLKTAKKEGWECNICKESFRTHNELILHRKEIHKSGQYSNISYDQVCTFCKRAWRTTTTGYKKHVKSCKLNPDRVPGDFIGKHHSEESKKKTSESQKRNLKDGKVFGYKLNHSSKVSYPEEYFMEVFKDIPYKYNYQVGLYQLDFAIPERKVYVEIDGEQHYTDKRIVEHDKERTSKLESLGWKCIKRVRWADYQKLSEEEKENYCKKLIDNFMDSK